MSHMSHEDDLVKAHSHRLRKSPETHVALFQLFAPALRARASRPRFAAHRMNEGALKGY